MGFEHTTSRSLAQRLYHWTTDDCENVVSRFGKKPCEWKQVLWASQNNFLFWLANTGDILQNNKIESRREQNINLKPSQNKFCLVLRIKYFLCWRKHFCAFFIRSGIRKKSFPLSILYKKHGFVSGCEQPTVFAKYFEPLGFYTWRRMWWKLRHVSLKPNLTNESSKFFGRKLFKHLKMRRAYKFVENISAEESQ